MYIVAFQLSVNTALRCAPHFNLSVNYYSTIMKKEKSFHISGKHSLAFTVYCETSKLFFTKIVNELVLFYQIPSLNSNEGISNTAHRAHTTNFPLSHTFSSSYKNTRLMISEKKKQFCNWKNWEEKQREEEEENTHVWMKKASHRIVARVFSWV